MENEDLLVFGYQCTIFRNDEKAAFIDAGKHLIQWNEGKSTEDPFLDRYDARIHLTNLKNYESLDKAESEGCEEESNYDEDRYRSLHESEREEEKNYNLGACISFNYNVDTTTNEENSQEPITLRALANIIEKTAEFIITHGTQMEILMRAKEAANPKFQFLNPDNPYNVIYKQVKDTKLNRSKTINTSHSPPFDVEKSLQELCRSLPSPAPGLSCSTSSYTSVSPYTSPYSKLVEKIKESQPSNHIEHSQTPPPITLPEMNNESIVDVVPPSSKSTMMLMDRTASYVAKNGNDMMSVVRKREPTLFDFLDESHISHSYFEYKVALYKEILLNPSPLLTTMTKDDKAFPQLKGFLP